jgi:hypothetical protein
MCGAKRHVCFTPDCDRKSRHRLTGRMLLKATPIYRRTGNLRAVQLLLGHTTIESTVRYLGIDVGDALTDIRCPLFRPLLGAKRTCLLALHMSAFDPKRTYHAA